MITSATVNKVVRRVIYPTLREIGFTKLRGRNAWRYLDDGIWVFNIRSVGRKFSDVTGFPPQSLTAWLGVYFLEFPAPKNASMAVSPKVDKDGLLIPQECECHVRYPLQVMEDQTKIRVTVPDDLGRRRDDIWWIDPEGENIEDVVSDVDRSIIEFGVPLLNKPYNSRLVQIERRGLSEPNTT